MALLSFQEFFQLSCLVTVVFCANYSKTGFGFWATLDYECVGPSVVPSSSAPPPHLLLFSIRLPSYLHHVTCVDLCISLIDLFCVLF